MISGWFSCFGDSDSTCSEGFRTSVMDFGALPETSEKASDRC